MGPVAAVYVYLEAGTPRYGLWCNDCRLPSAAEVDIWSLRPTCLIRLATQRRCLDCGSGNVEPPS